MARRTFGEDLATEVAIKAAIWVPGIVGTALLGPLGTILGAAVSAVILTSGNGADQSQQRPPSNS